MNRYAVWHGYDDRPGLIDYLFSLEAPDDETALILAMDRADPQEGEYLSITEDDE